ncbi:MAG: O-antigen ligase family protein [Solirubrobacterales bacterium]|nr:O-antigen ligase family protein [Solirubrobacterales bacterium]
MTDQPLLWIGTVACAGAAALALLPLAPGRRLGAIAVSLLLAPVLLLADNWESSRVEDLRGHPALLVVAAIFAIAGILVAAQVFRRRPALLAPALIAALPFRIPVDLGGGSANLLLPLYALLAAGVAAALLERGRGPAAERAPAGTPFGWPGSAGLIGPALAVVVVLYALQAGYAEDLSAAVKIVAFFLAPFAALYVLLERVEWDRRMLRTIVLVLAIEGLSFALVAAVQYATGELFWNDKVISGNEAHPYFRVNSLFWDPNILGRYLAISMVVFAAVVAFARRRAELVAASGVFVILLATLVVTFSQSSMIALLAGVLVLAATRWGIAVGTGAGVLTIVGLVAAIALIGGGGLSTDSSGRSGLIDGGLEIAGDAPLLGTGSGSFPDEFTDRFGGGEGIAVVSHTEPVTVAAEQGAIGLIAYLGLLAASLGALLAATGLSFRNRAGGTPLAAVLLALYVVMIVHSLGYAAFLTDPITWAILALAAAALAPSTAAESTV